MASKSKVYVEYKGQKMELIVIKALVRSGDKKDFWVDPEQLEIVKLKKTEREVWEEKRNRLRNKS